MTTKTSDSASGEVKRTGKRLTLDNVGELKALLEKTEPRARSSSREAVARMLPEIRELQTKGYTIIDICNMINDNGFDLPLSTFRSHLAKAGHRRNKRRKSAKQRHPTKSPNSPTTPGELPTDGSVGANGRFAVEDDKKL